MERSIVGFALDDDDEWALGIILGQLTFGAYTSGRDLVLMTATIVGLNLVLFLPIVVLDVDGSVADGWNALAPYLALFLAPSRR